MQTTKDLQLKLIFAGAPGVGKSAFVRALSNDKVFRRLYSPTAQIDFAQQLVYLRGKHLKLQLWDTPGNYPLRSILQDTAGVFICLDSTDTAENNENHLNARLAEIQQTQVFVILTKSDCVPRTSDADVTALLTAHRNVKFLGACSAQDSDSVRQILVKATELLIKQPLRGLLNNIASSVIAFLEQRPQKSHRYQCAVDLKKLLCREDGLVESATQAYQLLKFYLSYAPHEVKRPDLFETLKGYYFELGSMLKQPMEPVANPVIEDIAEQPAEHHPAEEWVIMERPPSSPRCDEDQCFTLTTTLVTALYTLSIECDHPEGQLPGKSHAIARQKIASILALFNRPAVLDLGWTGESLRINLVEIEKDISSKLSSMDKTDITTLMQQLLELKIPEISRAVKQFLPQEKDSQANLVLESPYGGW